MSRTKLFLRFVLALVAFVILSNPLAGMFTPPDPPTQLIALGVAALISLPIAVVFIRRSCSVKRLYKYLLAVCFVLFAVFGLFLGSILATRVIFGPTIQSDFVLLVAQSILLLFVYTLAFHLVYRGGYTRLKARLA